MFPDFNGFHPILEGLLDIFPKRLVSSGHQHRQGDWGCHPWEVTGSVIGHSPLQMAFPSSAIQFRVRLFPVLVACLPHHSSVSLPGLRLAVSVSGVGSHELPCQLGPVNGPWCWRYLYSRF